MISPQFPTPASSGSALDRALAELRDVEQLVVIKHGCLG